MNRLCLYTPEPEIRLMQITDLHLALQYGLKRVFLRRLARLVREEKPDLLVNTGDLFCKRTVAPVRQVIRLFQRTVGKLGPWTFAWGNHDLELLRGGGHSSRFDLVEKEFRSISTCLYASAHLPRPGCTGSDAFTGGNFLIEIRKRDGEPGDKPLWHIFILNSGKNQHLMPPVFQWMDREIRATGRTVPAICFFHRPIRETARAAVREIQDGYCREKASCGGENGLVHHSLKALGTIKACFYGHDHVNHFLFQKEGIAYVYGRKTLPFSYGAASLPWLARRRKRCPRDIAWGYLRVILQAASEEEPSGEAIRIESVMEDGTVDFSWTVPHTPENREKDFSGKLFKETVCF